MPKPWGKFCYILFSVLCGICVFIFCEYLIYYPTIFQCSWPNTDHEPSGGSNDVKVLRVIFLSDTHLLGAIRGHWFDKLRREWQMERSFQTALWLLQPEVVFILGDVFDEGKWSSAEDWDDDVRRFQQMFRHPNNTEMIVLVGNHDVGFHYQMDMVKLHRFEKIFNNTSAKMVTRKGVNFLLVNSVAMQGDNCPICRGVESKLRQLSQQLNCSLRSVQSGAVKKCNEHQKYPPSLPIILQHYPLYRASDANCTGPDAAPANERHLLFKEQYDVLSQEASRKLLWWFKPRLILSGHTHSACEVLHERKHPEVSVPSFSWRNRNNPSFMLGVFSPSSFALSKCFLPEESTVFVVYVVTGAVLGLLGLLQVCLLRAGGAGFALKHKLL